MKAPKQPLLDPCQMCIMHAAHKPTLSNSEDLHDSYWSWNLYMKWEITAAKMKTNKRNTVCISEFLIMCCYGMHDDRASRLMMYIPGQELHGTRQAKNTGTDHSRHIVESRIPPFSIPAPCHR